MAENKRLLTDVLRNEWGFDGIVVSDWGAINDRMDDGLTEEQAIAAIGTPEEVAMCDKSYTAKFLREKMNESKGKKK